VGVFRLHPLDARYTLGFLRQRYRHFPMGVLQGKQHCAKAIMADIIGDFRQHCQLCVRAHPVIQAEAGAGIERIFR
jgi:hypothetical protein